MANKNSTKAEEIIKLLEADHMPLKKCIKIMKDSDKSLTERRAAFKQFCPLLTLHAKAEEKVLYTFMKEEVDMQEEGLEGDVEHTLAEQLMDEAKRTEDSDLFSAKIKVLAELVEHHLEEEEDEMFPDFKKKVELGTRQELGMLYLEEKANVKLDEKETAKIDQKEHSVAVQH